MRRHKACAKLSLASPLGGRWCPVGTVQRLTEPAGESGLALARTERASCQPHRPLPWLSPLRARAPRSLVSFWLTPTKVKTVGRCPTPCKLFEKSLSKNFYAASRVSSPKNCLYQIKKVYTVHTRRLLSALPFLWSSSSLTSFSVWKNFWAFSPKNSSLTML